MGGLGLAFGIGSLLASGAAAAPAIMNYGPERRKALIREGPDDFGDYNFRPGDKLAIEEESLPASQKKYYRNQILKNGEVRSAQRMARSKGKELPVLPGMKDSQDFLDTYSTDILKLQKGVIREGKQEDLRLNFSSPGEREARRVAAEARNDQLLQYSRERSDRNQSRLDELDYLRSRDNKEDLRYNEMMERENKKDRRAAISSTVAGLVALGAAFAV